jgi:guanine nucleotide-binding protein alpha-1 subunit
MLLTSNSKSTEEFMKSLSRMSEYVFPQCHLSPYLTLIFSLPQLLLLGQAESGKSTLQKQFQLMYSPDTLDKERASWRMVIYFNVARSVKRVLEYLDFHGDTFDADIPDAPQGPGNDSMASKKTIEDLIREDAVEDTSLQSSRSYSSPVPPVLTEAQKQIATLRLRLSPVVAAENTLADRLSGGIRVSGSGRDNVFVRHGWQLRSAARNSYLSSRSRGTSGTTATPVIESGNHMNFSEVVEEVGRILDASKEDIKALWWSDVVQKMIKRRRLRLEEWAELYASIRTPPKFMF